jgi:hypothetical protein
VVIAYGFLLHCAFVRLLVSTANLSLASDVSRGREVEFPRASWSVDDAKSPSPQASRSASAASKAGFVRSLQKKHRAAQTIQASRTRASQFGGSERHHGGGRRRRSLRRAPKVVNWLEVEEGTLQVTRTSMHFARERDERSLRAECDLPELAIPC